MEISTENYFLFVNFRTLLKTILYEIYYYKMLFSIWNVIESWN